MESRFYNDLCWNKNYIGKTRCKIQSYLVI